MAISISYTLILYTVSITVTKVLQNSPEIFVRKTRMSTAWRAENRAVNYIAAVCSYVPVSWLKSGRVA